MRQKGYNSIHLIVTQLKVGKNICSISKSWNLNIVSPSLKSVSKYKLLDAITTTCVMSYERN